MRESTLGRLIQSVARGALSANGALGGRHAGTVPGATVSGPNAVRMPAALITTCLPPMLAESSTPNAGPMPTRSVRGISNLRQAPSRSAEDSSRAKIVRPVGRSTLALLLSSDRALRGLNGRRDDARDGGWASDSPCGRPYEVAAIENGVQPRPVRDSQLLQLPDHAIREVDAAREVPAAVGEYPPASVVMEGERH